NCSNSAHSWQIATQKLYSKIQINLGFLKFPSCFWNIHPTKTFPRGNAKKCINHQTT
uniref:Uncharacterized protein n=1 Tax=Salvator merianae TaxID=96440 RepID=A0A8D0E2Z6_SALMN